MCKNKNNLQGIVITQMDQSELVISILLDNHSAFHYLSAHEIGMFMTSCKNAYNSKVLQTMRAKYRAWYLYDKAFNMMDEAHLVLKYYRTSDDLDLSRKLFDNHKQIVKSFDDETIDTKDCLSRILIAEYKELLYGLAYDCVEKSLYYHYEALYQTFRYNMLLNLPYCNIVTHIHDPMHYTFMNIDSTYYTFYNKIEKQGKSVLQDARCKKYIDMMEGNDNSDDE